MSGFQQSVRDAVAHRSGLLCEGCGGQGPLQLHHRQFRSRRGPDTASNALALCGLGNIDGCHGAAHAGYRGESLGWAIRSGAVDHELVPAFRKSDATWWRFDNDGGKEQIHPADAVEYLKLIGAIREGLMH